MDTTNTTDLQQAFAVIAAVRKHTRKGFECDGITVNGDIFTAYIYTGLADPRDLVAKFRKAGALVSRLHNRSGQWWEVRFTYEAKS